MPMAKWLSVFSLLGVLALSFGLVSLYSLIQNRGGECVVDLEYVIEHVGASADADLILSAIANLPCERVFSAGTVIHPKPKDMTDRVLQWIRQNMNTSSY